MERSTSTDTAISPSARSTIPFFVGTLGSTWLLQLPAFLAQRGYIAGPIERYMPIAALGAFSPILVAILVSRLQLGRGGVGQLFRSIRIWRVGVHWYFLALGLFAAIYVTGTAAYSLLGGMNRGPWLYPPENAQHLAALVMMPLVEEPGWRGFALPRLQRSFSPLQSSLVLGILWAFWHTFMFLVAGMTPAMFVVAIINVAVGSVIFSWIYNRTKGSLLLAILAHIGVHLNNPTHSLPAHPTPFVIYTISIVVAACLVVAFDRKAWTREITKS